MVSIAITIWRFVVGAILLLAAASKALTFEDFKGYLAAYAIFPQSIVPEMSVTVISVEAALGLCLFIGINLFVSFLLSWIVFTVFGLVVTYEIVHGKRNLPCGCGVSRHSTVGWHLVLRNVMFGTLSLVAACVLRIGA